MWLNFSTTKIHQQLGKTSTVTGLLKAPSFFCWKSNLAAYINDEHKAKQSGSFHSKMTVKATMWMYFVLMTRTLKSFETLLYLLN